MEKESNDELNRQQVKRQFYPQLGFIDKGYWYRFFLEKDDSKTEIRYKLLIKFIRQQSETSGLVLIDRISDVHINDQLPSRSFDQLAYETGKVFYPLVVEMDTTNNWLNICNHNQIIAKWKQISKQAKLCFSGEEVDRYLSHMDEVIADKEKIKRILEDDLPMQLCFKTIYHPYRSLFETENLIGFSVGDYAPVPFQVKHLLQKNINDNGIDEVLQTGNEIRKNDQIFEQLGIEKVDNTYIAKFVLNTKTQWIQEVEAEWDFKFPIQKKMRVILFPLRQQPPKDKINYIIDENCKPYKKSIISVLFGK